MFIPGGRAGGERLSRFNVGEAHTVYEWVMIWGDRHPKIMGADESTDAEGVRGREVMMGARSTSRHYYSNKQEQRQVKRRVVANEVYRDILRGIERGTIEPLKLAYCNDRSWEPDPTRHVIGVKDILKLADRRKDAGRCITKMLEARRARSMSLERRHPSTRKEATKLLNQWTDEIRATGEYPSEARLIAKAEEGKIYIRRTWRREFIEANLGTKRGRPINRNSQRK